MEELLLGWRVAPGIVEFLPSRSGHPRGRMSMKTGVSMYATNDTKECCVSLYHCQLTDSTASDIKVQIEPAFFYLQEHLGQHRNLVIAATGQTDSFQGQDRLNKPYKWSHIFDCLIYTATSGWRTLLDSIENTLAEVMLLQSNMPLPLTKGVAITGHGSIEVRRRFFAAIAQSEHAIKSTDHRHTADRNKWLRSPGCIRDVNRIGPSISTMALQKCTLRTSFESEMYPIPFPTGG